MDFAFGDRADGLRAELRDLIAAEVPPDFLGAFTDDPRDLEIAFMLASGYLRLKNTEAAARTFDQIVAARPLPQTHVLIGRTYRDFGEYGRARTALNEALKRDPRVRRAPCM